MSSPAKVAVVVQGITRHEFRVGEAPTMGTHYWQQLGKVQKINVCGGTMGVLEVIGEGGYITFGGAGTTWFVVESHPTEEQPA